MKNNPFFNGLLSQSGSLADANVYRFSSKEWVLIDATYARTIHGLYYYGHRFYSPFLQRWLNRDPMGEPGFETLHLVTQPLFIRKLRLNINDSEMQLFLAMAIQSGGINIADYLRNSHTPYDGNIISTLAFLNLLRNRQANYAPNWPAELLEGPNLFGFVGNDPLDRTDPFGLWWGPIPTHGEDWKEVWEWFKTVFSHASDATDIANMGNDTLKCGLGMYNIYTNEPPKYRFINNPENPTNPVPITAG